MRPCTRRVTASVPVTVIALALAACAGGRPIPPESFVWRGRPVSFSPPPSEWRREALNEAGVLGVRFVHEGSPGRRIEVGDLGVAAPPGDRLEDVVGRLRARPGWSAGPDQAALLGRDTTLAGRPARVVDFAWRATGEGATVGRQFFVVAGDHRFVAAFRGLERDRKIFDRLVASISFPDTAGPAVPDIAR